MNKELLKQLNSLTEKSLALERIYTEAEKNLESSDMVSYFKKNREIRKKFNEELMMVIYDLGGKYTEDKNPTENKPASVTSRSLIHGSSISKEKLIKDSLAANNNMIGNYDLLISNADLPEKYLSLLKQQRNKTEHLALNMKTLDDDS